MESAAATEVNETSLQEMGGRVLSMAPDAGFSGKPEDFAKDIAHLAAKEAPPAAPAVAVVTPPPAAPAPAEPAQPESTPPAAATPPEVPAKFQDKEGKLDEGKLAKSTVDAEKALAHYKDVERQLRQKQSEVSKLKADYPAAPEPTPAPPALDPVSFEAKLEADIKKEGYGPVLARLFTAASEHGYQRAVSEIEGIKTESELSKRERELTALGQTDPWVFSEEGMARLAEIRKASPHLNGHPAAWTEAYKLHLGEQAYRTKTAGQVQTPNPTAAKAPPAPIQAAPRSSGAADRFQSKEAATAFLDRMTPEQQDAFFASQGLPPLSKKGR